MCTYANKWGQEIKKGMNPERGKGAGKFGGWAVRISKLFAEVGHSHVPLFPAHVQPSQIENYKNHPWKLYTSAGLKNESFSVLRIF